MCVGMQTVCSIFVIFLLFVAHGERKSNERIVVLTNNHTNYLSIRCFSFDDGFSVAHLPSWGQYKFRVNQRVIYPSSTVFNCSTNMGTFVAFKDSYDCNEGNFDTCEWRFDENNAYLLNPLSRKWIQFDYAPNYESLERGGVIQGYFSN